MAALGLGQEGPRPLPCRELGENAVGAVDRPHSLAGISACCCSMGRLQIPSQPSTRSVWGVRAGSTSPWQGAAGAAPWGWEGCGAALQKRAPFSVGCWGSPLQQHMLGLHFAMQFWELGVFRAGWEGAGASRSWLERVFPGDVRPHEPHRVCAGGLCAAH